MRLLPKDHELGWTPYGWLIYLPTLFLQPWLGHDSATRWVVTILGILVFLPLYFRGYWLAGRRLLWIIGGIVALGLICMPINMAGGVYFIYAAGFAGAVARRRTGRTIVALITLLTLSEVWVFGLPLEQWIWVVVFTILIGAINIHYAEVRRTNAKIRLAQEEIEHLAKVAERERIARDLHDLLGHTLSLIVLKSELASKLAETDPARARAEIRDVERISRETLAEVRTAVRGYRSLGLREQLDTARSALGAAGVSAEMSVETIPLTSAQEAVLAMAVREAATNIVRHAEATSAVIRLAADDELITLEIRDDGRGSSEAEGAGLAGMRERITEMGGTLARDSSRGTRITVTLPVDRSANVLPIEARGA